MKRIWMTMLAVILVISMATPANAAGEKMSIGDAQGVPGDTVYLRVVLNESVKCDALAVQYSFDSDVLEALIDSHTWNTKGLLQAFDYDHTGVWANDKVMDAKGAVCVLAFRIRDIEKFENTTVRCTLIAKNGSVDAGTFEAEAVISSACAHDFGEWTSVEQYDHTRRCKLCSLQQTQSHTWDNGVLVDNPDNALTAFMKYTCKVCGGSYQVEVSAGENQDATTPPGVQESVPSVTPTEPVTKPTDPNNPGNNSGQGGNPNQGGYPNQGGNSNQGGYPNQGGNSNQGGYPNQGSNSNQGGYPNQGGNPNHGGNSNQTGNSNQGGTGNIGGYVVQEDPAATTSPTEHDHDHAEDTFPISVPIVTNPNATEATHDHEHETEMEHTHISAASIIAFCGFFVVAAGGLIYFTKKKR